MLYAIAYVLELFLVTHAIAYIELPHINVQLVRQFAI